MIKFCQERVRTAERSLKLLQAELAAALRADSVVEEMARQLWVDRCMVEADEDDRFYEKLSTSIEYRDEKWNSAILMESERDQLRTLAMRFIDSALDLLSKQKG